jgi:hypothetical protein
MMATRTAIRKFRDYKENYCSNLEISSMTLPFKDKDA